MNALKRISVLSICVLVSCMLRANEFTVPRLSPLPVGMQKEMVSLHGEWKFQPQAEEGFWKNTNTSHYAAIEVPGEWLMQGFKVEKGQAAGYIRTFDIPKSWEGKRIKLRCNAIYSESTIYINGEEVGTHIGGFTPFEFDVSSHLRYGTNNQIAISVLSESLADSLASGSQYAAHQLGGITRDIYLFALPEVNFSLFHATTDFDENYENAILKAEVEIANESMKDRNNLRLNFSLKDADGKEVSFTGNTQSLVAIQQEGRLLKEVAFHINKPSQWTSEHPYLYTFICELWDGNNLLSTTSRRIGFRKIEIVGNQMFINNKPVKLRGVCRHEVMPLRGRSLTGDIWQKDVEIFREANVNYIRTSHYPPDEALLEACDELGMFVEVEAPFCWAHQTKVNEEDAYMLLVNQHIEMVNRDRTHPSVIMWSLGNESLKYEEYFKKAGEVIKAIDPDRPRIFSQWGPDADNGELEVTNHHYPGPTGPDKYRNSNRPVTFDEFCHLNSYNRFELAADPGIRNMWGVLLDRMWNDMYNSQGVLGGALWAGIDDTFFIPNGNAVGYGTWGPIDGWRRLKPEYWNVKKAYSPVRIQQQGNITNEGVVHIEIENRHNFTNLSECTFEWKYGKKKGLVNIDLEAREKGNFEISLPSITANDRDLYLTITSPLGFVIDEYNFQVLPDTHIVTDLKEKKKNNLSVINDTEEVISIKVSDLYFKLNKRNGLIEVYNTRQTPLLKHSPSLMLLPLNSEGNGIQMLGNDMNFAPYTPVCSDWVCKAITYEKKENSFHIKVDGHYKEAEGSYLYEIKSDGGLVVTYDFDVLKDVIPRQVGVVFSLADSFTSLTWKRKGYWSVYPKNHLGALEGEAKSFDPGIPVSGSAGPDKKPHVEWSFDQNSAGSNLFRSTKENILNAKLISSKLGQVEVRSNGKQHLRVWIDKAEQSIKMLVADYNNAGREGFLSSHAEKDYKPLKRGDKVQGTITLKF